MRKYYDNHQTDGQKHKADVKSTRLVEPGKF